MAWVVLLAEGRGLALNSLGGEPRNPSASCGEAKLGASSQVFDGARRARDWCSQMILRHAARGCSDLVEDLGCQICHFILAWELR